MHIPTLNGRVHGTYRAFYDNGEKSAEVQFNNGMRHGIYKTWTRTGDLLSHILYEKGRIKQVFFDSNHHWMVSSPIYIPYNECGWQWDQLISDDLSK